MAVKVDKAKAIKLRSEGFTYKEISESLGCSENWCKKNLKGISPTPVLDRIVEEVKRLGRSPQGVTYGQIKSLVVFNLPKIEATEDLNKHVAHQIYLKREKEVEETVAKVKDAARRGNRTLRYIEKSEKEVVIRPYWLLPESPQDCINTINDMAQHVYEILHNLADSYRRLYDLDESYQNSVVYELSRLSAPANTKILPQGFIERGAQLEGIAEVLTERNTKEPETKSGILKTNPKVIEINEPVATQREAELRELNDKEERRLDQFMSSMEDSSIDEHFVLPPYFDIPMKGNIVNRDFTI
jgi:hypothetical protein